MTFPGIDDDIKVLAQIAAINDEMDDKDFQTKMDLLAIYTHSAARATEGEGEAEEE